MSCPRYTGSIVRTVNNSPALACRGSLAVSHECVSRRDGEQYLIKSYVVV